MTEVLTRFPDAPETEVQFEQFDQIKTEELLFPKLDGILLPIVMDNADVVAPCQWMGGAEVSLSTALNNYYRPMTEESADEVIAEVYEFLAGQFVPETVTKQESDYAIEPMLTLVPQVESVAYDEHAYTIDETQSYIPQIHAEPAGNAAPAKMSVDMHEAPSDKAMPRQAQPVSRLLADDEKKEHALEISQPTSVQSSDTASTLPASMKPYVLEVDRKYVINHAPFSEPTIKTKELLSTDISGVPIPPRSTNLEAEHVDPVRDELSWEAPLADTEASERLQSVEDEGMRVHEKPAEYEPTNTNEHPEEHDSLNTENAPLEAAHEAASTTSDSARAIMEIDSLFSDVRQPAGIDESNEPETAKGLVEIIADMTAGLELDDDDTEIVTNEETVQEELATLYTELLDGSPFNHRDKFIHLLVALTTESGNSRESSIQTPAAAMHKKVKSLKVVIKKLRQIGNHVIAIGRLALRSQAVVKGIHPPVGLYTHGVRD